jgi:hypothetical protein
MAFETVHLLGKVELDLDTSGPMTFTLLTDQPGDAMTVRHSEAINTETTTAGRRTIEFRLPGKTKGQLLDARISGPSVCRLYGARVWASAIGGTAPGGWGWYSLPCRVTPDGFAAAPLPITPTPEAWSKALLPITPTPEAWNKAALPIDPTPETWTRGPLPIPQTPAIPRWVDLAVDAVE